MEERKPKFLICTVGGSPEPVVAALKHWRPMRVYFVHTPRSRHGIEGAIVAEANDGGLALDAGRYQCFELSDGQDLPAFPKLDDGIPAGQ
jgi:hypothetical protein